MNERDFETLYLKKLLQQETHESKIKRHELDSVLNSCLNRWLPNEITISNSWRALQSFLDAFFVYNRLNFLCVIV